jgi:hypothetical protein
VPVGAYDKFSKGAKAYKEFTREVEERTKWAWKVLAVDLNPSFQPI